MKQGGGWAAGEGETCEFSVVQNSACNPAWEWSRTVPPPGSKQNGRQDVEREGWMDGCRGVWGWEACLSVDKRTNSSLVKGSSRGLVIRDESWVRNKGTPTGYRTAA